MKNFINETQRNLEYEEHKAILEAGEILAKAFKKKVHQVKVAPNTAEPTDVWGIMYGFDLSTEGYK